MCEEKLTYAEAALVAAAIPVPPPTVKFGTALAAPLLESTGPVTVIDPSMDLVKAIAALKPGGVLRLRGGDYGKGLTSQAQVPVLGSALAPVTIESYPGEQANIAQYVKVTGDYVRLRRLAGGKNSYPTDTRYWQGPAPGGNTGIWVSGHHNAMEFCDFSLATMSGIFNDGDFTQILCCRVSVNGSTPDDHGVYAYGSDVLIAGCLITFNQTFGVQLAVGARDRVVGNTIVVPIPHRDAAHPGSPIVTFKGVSGALVAYNVLLGGEVAVKTYDTGNTVKGNIWNGAGAFSYGSWVDGGGNRHVDPMLDASYRPLPGSPCIGTADPAFLLPFLPDGSPRLLANVGAW